MENENRSYGANICFDCENYAGGCCWTEVDPETNKIRFEPVPGWTAEKHSTLVPYTRDGKEFVRVIDTYHITDCPLQVKTPPRKAETPQAKKIEQMDRKCLWCGKPLISRANNAVYCSRECKKANQKAMDAKWKKVHQTKKTDRGVSQRKPVIRIDPKTGERERFPTITAAAWSADGSRTAVHHAIMVERVYKGFFWRYADEDC